MATASPRSAASAASSSTGRRPNRLYTPRAQHDHLDNRRRGSPRRHRLALSGATARTPAGAIPLTVEEPCIDDITELLSFLPANNREGPSGGS